MNTTLEANHTLKLRLAAEEVDRQGGILKGCTVAQAGVEATGKFVMIDAEGRVTHEEAKAVRELPVWTDAKTLETLLAAAAARPRFKVREDHDDSIGARAGYAATFRAAGPDRVVADVKVYENYRHRDLVLETIAETPDQIGLSIDFLPSFELVDGKALMRVDRLDAVDLVDEGAITHKGLFLSAGVDSPENGKPASGKTEPARTMPDEKKPATNEDVMAAMNKMADTITGCMTAMTSAITAMAKPAPAAAGASEEMSALKTQVTQLASSVDGLKQEKMKLEREAQLLRLRTPAQRAALGAAADEVIRDAVAKQKSFRELCLAHRAANQKMSAQESTQAVLRTEEGRAAYRAQLTARGIASPEQVGAN